MTPRFLPFEYGIFLGSYDVNRPTDLYYIIRLQQPHLCARSDHYENYDALITLADNPHIIDPELLEAQKRAICQFLPLINEQSNLVIS